MDACLRVEIATGENRNFQFKTHPNIDKQLYARNNVLGLKDPSRPFPTEGAPVGILKWRMQVAAHSFCLFILLLLCLHLLLQYATVHLMRPRTPSFVNIGHGTKGDFFITRVCAECAALC